MKLYSWIFVSCVVVLSLTSCSQPEPAVEQQSAQPPAQAQQSQPAPEPVTPPAVEGQATIGQLQSVDLTAKMITVINELGNKEMFSFSDSTEIVGASSAQGLANQQGTRVTVHYADQDGRRTATRIEIAAK